MTTRRLCNYFPLLLAGLCAILTLPAAATDASPRPNILFIVADDLGYNDLGFRGSEISTPSIDKLANEGVRLDQFYVQPMCTPTRAALMTGRYPLRYGLQTLVIPSGMSYGLSTEERLLPQALKEAGYRTVMVGKWHLGHANQKYWPKQRGFDYFYGAVLGEIDYFTHSAHGVRDWYRNNEPVNEQGYVTRLLGNDAVARIMEHDPNTSLFMYLAFTAPHTPFQAPPEDIAKNKHIKDPTRRTYAAMISVMDEEIGRVLAALEQKGMRENTLVLFMSDNGGTTLAALAGEADVSKLKLPADNSPYRGGKGMLYEGGTRVTALANWPGQIEPGVVNEVVHVVDMFPTLAGLAGADTGTGKPLDGMDAWPVISRGRPSARSEVVYNVEPFRAGIRQGDWKLVWRTPLPSALELYNIALDPHESTDLAATEPDKVAALKKRAEQLAGESEKALFLVETQTAVMGMVKDAPPCCPTTRPTSCRVIDDCCRRNAGRPDLPIATAVEIGRSLHSG